MKKLGALLFTIILISCGKPGTIIEPGPEPESEYSPLVTYNVPTSYYNRYKADFDAVASDLISLTGKQLVRFVPNDSNPKFKTFYDAAVKYNGKEAWILFKENNDQFTDVSNNSSGAAYIGSNTNPRGLVVLNFAISMSWDGGNVRRILNHEVLHCLGFNHTFDFDYSVMNYRYTLKLNGITNVDVERLASAFPFSMEVVTIKDLEKMAAFNEKEEVEKYAYNLMENFGLSEVRAKTISRHLISYKKLSGKRALTSNEKDTLSKEILGFGFEKGKLALEKYIQGEKEGLDTLIEIAATKNETSPEHIKELVGEILLK